MEVNLFNLHTAVTGALISISGSIKSLNDDAVLIERGFTEASQREQIKLSVHNFLYSKDGLVATFSEIGTPKEMAQRIVGFIDKAEKHESHFLSEILPRIAKQATKSIYQKTPEIGSEIDGILSARKGRD